MDTLKAVAERWLTTLRLRETSRGVYARHLRLYVYPTYGDRPFAELRRRDFRDLFRGLLNEGYAPNTIRQTAGIITTLYADAVEDDIIPVNHVRALTRRILSSRDQGPRPPVVLDIDQVHALQLGAQLTDPDTADFVLLLSRTGLRNGEALALQKPLVGLDHGQLLIGTTWLDDRLGPTKSGRMRRIDLTPATLRMLEEREERVESWLFPRTDGIPWTRTQAARRVADAAKAARLPRVTPHHLRHTYATILKEMGVPLAYIQYQLGHSSIEITNDLYAETGRPPRPVALDRLDTLGKVHRPALRVLRSLAVLVGGAATLLVAG